MGNNENSGILALVGIVILIFGLMVGLIAGIEQIRGSKDSNGNPQGILPLLSSSLIWYGIAIVLIFLGILLVFFGRG